MSFYYIIRSVKDDAEPEKNRVRGNFLNKGWATWRRIMDLVFENNVDRFPHRLVLLPLSISVANAPVG